MVKITLKGSRINYVPLDRVYQVRNPIVNKYNDTKSLNTNRQTVFTVSDHNIQPSKVTLTDLVIRRLKFAPEVITDMDVKITCPRCGTYVTNGNSKVAVQ